MIRIKKLAMNNWCQFRGPHEFDLDGGLVGIFGPNGAGKSNLLAAIRFLLTGQSGNPGKQNDDITEGEKECEVALLFSIDGKDAVLRRHLPSGRASFAFDNEEMTRTSDIKKEILGFLGADDVAAVQSIFAKQGELAEIAFADPAVRERQFQRRCGVHRIELARQAVLEERSLVPPETQILDEEVLVRDLDGLESGLLQLRRNKVEADRGILPSGTLKALKASVAASEDAVKLSGRLAMESDTLNKLTAEMDGKKRELQVASDRAAPVIEEFNRMSRDIDKARDLVSAAAALEREIKLRGDLLAEREDCTKLLSAAEPENPCPDADERIRGLSKLRDSALVVAAQTDNVISAFSDGKTECPTCGQRVPDPKKLVSDARNSLGLARKTLEALDGEISEKTGLRDAHHRRLSAWRAGRDAAEKAVKKIDARLSDLPGEGMSEKTAASVEIARKMIERFSSVRDEATRFEKLIAPLRNSITLLSGEQAGAFRNISTIRSEIKRLGNVLVGEDISKAADAIAGHETSVSESEKLGVSIKLTEERIASQKEAVARMLEAKKRNDSIRGYRAFLDRILGIMNRDGLPRLLVQTGRARLNILMNHFLQMFELPFSIEVGENMQMEAVFDSGKRLAATRLSGGERMLLSIAELFAENEMFCRDAGVIFFDEPTAYIDQDRRVSMREVFLSVKRAVHSMGSQVFLVTHEDGLKGTADIVIDVGKT